MSNDISLPLNAFCRVNWDCPELNCKPHAKTISDGIAMFDVHQYSFMFRIIEPTFYTFNLRLLINLMLQCMRDIISFLKYTHWLHRWFTFFWNILTEECNHISIYCWMYGMIIVEWDIILLFANYWEFAPFDTSSKNIIILIVTATKAHIIIICIAFWCSR